jgi:hypothetical protein
MSCGIVVIYIFGGHGLNCVMANWFSISGIKNLEALHGDLPIPQLWLACALSAIAGALVIGKILSQQWALGIMLACVVFWAVCNYRIYTGLHPSLTGLASKKPALIWALMAILTTGVGCLVSFAVVDQLLNLMVNVSYTVYDVFYSSYPLIQSAINIMTIAHLWVGMLLPLAVGLLWYQRVLKTGYAATAARNSKVARMLPVALIVPMASAIYLRGSVPLEIHELQTWLGEITGEVCFGFSIAFALAAGALTPVKATPVVPTDAAAQTTEPVPEP